MAHYLLILSTLLGLIACTQSQPDSTDSGNGQNSEVGFPRQLAVSATLGIWVGQCALGVTLNLEQTLGYSKADPTSTFSINSSDIGKFYSDSECKNSLAEVALGGSKPNSQELYFKGEKAGEAIFTLKDQAGRIGQKSISIRSRGACDDSPAFGSLSERLSSLGGNERVMKLAVQNDGKILGVGVAQSGPQEVAIVFRTNASGAPDGSFGCQGGSFYTSSLGDSAYAAVAIQSDGKIVAVGYQEQPSGTLDFLVSRFLPNGILDITFGTNGSIILDFSRKNDRATAVALDSRQNIIVIGSVQAADGRRVSAAIIRLTPAGKLDRSFALDGLRTIQFATPGNSEATSLAILQDGKMVIGGNSIVGGISNFAFAFITVLGELDATKGTAGIRIVDPSPNRSDALSAVIISNGEILGAGTSHNGLNSDFSVVQLTSEGSINTTFGSNGIATFDVVAGKDDVLTGADVQADGKILLTGYSNTGPVKFSLSLIRMFASGAREANFSSTMTQLTVFGPDISHGFSVLNHPSDGIFVGGSSYNPASLGAQFDFALAKVAR